MLLEIFTPIIFAIGLLGNAVNLYVFTKPMLRSLSTFRFLVYLSIIDLLYILIGIPHIMVIIYKDYDFRDYSHLICALHTFFTIYFSHLSSNVLAAVGIFRCVAINSLKPVVYKSNNHQHLKTKSHMNNNKTTPNNSDKNLKVVKSSNKRMASKIFFFGFFNDFGSADLIVLLIMFICFLFNFHSLIWMRLTDARETSYYMEQTNNTLENYADFVESFRNESKHLGWAKIMKCYPSLTINERYFQFYTKLWPWIDLFLYSYIPFLIMLVCTILIIFRLVTINNNLRSHQPSVNNINQVIKADAASKMRPNESRSMLDMDESVNLNTNTTTNNNNLLRVNPTSATITSVKSSSNLEREKSKKRTKKNNQIYKLLLTLNLFFFVLVAPIVTANTFGILQSENHSTTEIVYILAYLNHCLNFIFYGLSCKIYRQILIDRINSFFYKTYRS